jgi:hypothetical protein
MVQVDVFWAYGIGAGFAVAASHQLVTGSRRPLLQEPQAVSTLLYCGLLFAPSGAWLLWAFPSWETMQVADTHAALPAWLVALFAITNVSQGLLGFWVARRLIQRGRAYAAFLQAGLGYLGMFFILVHGWDGTGYRRFFSPDQAAFGRWQADGGPIPIARWFGSPVALTLYGMGAVLIPVMVGLMVTWLRDGQRAAGVKKSLAGLAIGLVAGIVGLGLGTAIVASALVNLTGWWIGVPLAAAVTWLVVTRRRTGLAHLLFRRLALSG